MHIATCALSKVSNTFTMIAKVIIIAKVCPNIFVINLNKEMNDSLFKGIADYAIYVSRLRNKKNMVCMSYVPYSTAIVCLITAFTIYR